MTHAEVLESGGFVRASARANGPVRVLTQLSYLGYYFSPLTLFHCFGPDGVAVQAIVAVVQNTPWWEQHAYVLSDGIRQTSEGDGVYRHAKTFHVSPFMGMNIDYRWRIRDRGETFQVGIENLVDDEQCFAPTCTFGGRR